LDPQSKSKPKKQEIIKQSDMEVLQDDKCTQPTEGGVRGESLGSAIMLRSILLPSSMEGLVRVRRWEVKVIWDTGVSGDVLLWEGTNNCSPPRGIVPLSDSLSNKTELVSSVPDPLFL
jgi:hypothetical protein